MINLDKLRSDMEAFLEAERNQKSIYLTGFDLEELLREAAVQLNTPTRKLSYEVLSAGRKGFLNFGATKWNILVYRDEASNQVILPTDIGRELAGDEEGTVHDENGDFFIRSTSEILLKVTPPKGDGAGVNLERILQQLAKKGITGYKESSLHRILSEEKGVYVSIAARKKFDPSQNPIMSIERDEDNMEAFLTLSAPGEGGADVMEEDIQTMLKRQGISERAVLRGEIVHFVDRPVYNTPVLVAKGLAPVDGEAGHIHYFYRSEKENKFKESRSGQINFKEMSLIQNIKKGDVLAERIPPREGQEGYDLDGRLLMPKRGEEVQFTVGTNVEVSADGNQLLSQSDGYIIFKDRVLNVENVYVIDGDVGPTTGNIYNNGAVLVKGSVMDGFVMEVGGNLEITGSVGRAKITSLGDVVLHLGVNGNYVASIKTEGNVWAKFIENSQVQAGKSVFVSDGILYSKVMAGETIICQGKRAKIVGGQIMATEEVVSVDLGAVGSGETIVEVGFRPEDVELVNALTEWLSTIDTELNELTKNIQTFEKQVRRGETPAAGKEKMPVLSVLKGDFDVISAERGLVAGELETFQAKLNENNIKGKVSVARIAYPGVTLKIDGILHELTHEISKATFLMDEEKIKTVPYEPVERDIRADRPSIDVK